MLLLRQLVDCRKAKTLLLFELLFQLSCLISVGFPWVGVGDVGCGVREGGWGFTMLISGGLKDQVCRRHSDLPLLLRDQRRPQVLQGTHCHSRPLEGSGVNGRSCDGGGCFFLFFSILQQLH